MFTIIYDKLKIIIVSCNQIMINRNSERSIRLITARMHEKDGRIYVYIIQARNVFIRLADNSDVMVSCHVVEHYAT